MFMDAMAMVLSRKIAENFQSFVEIRNFDPHFKNLSMLEENGFKELALVWFESLF